MSNEIFVFGSNTQGYHSLGAAHTARVEYGAIYGQARGKQGDAYAIVTKELRSHLPPIKLASIEGEVKEFLDYAREHPELTFKVTRIGCGLTGFKDEQIAPMFKDHPSNCKMPPEWKKYL